MPQIVNTNIASLNAQRNLNRSQSELSLSLQRISSGLRVNSAKDDAAGLAIANRMTTQIRGFTQAARNAADAISLAQTGEGSLQEITNNLQRMRELAVQARNATNTDVDRQSLDSEFQQLLAEIDRVAQTTSFNGRKVLDGSLGTSVFQVGANVGDTISVDVSSSMRTNAIGNVATSELALINPTVANATNFAGLTMDNVSMTAGTVQINSVANQAAQNDANGLGDGSAASIANAVNLDTDSHGVTATANATTATITNANFSAALTFTDASDNDTLTYELQVNGVSVTTQTEGSTTISSQSDLITSINAVSKQTGVIATLQSNGDIKLTASDGRNIEVAEQIAASSDATDAVTGFFGASIVASGGATAAAGSTFKGSISLSATRDISVTDVAGGSTYFTGIADGGVSVSAASTIAQANLLSGDNADGAILRLDRALSEVDTLRGVFGAIQSRFESTIANLQAAAENASAARSRIVDADFAAETARLTRAQILQQAGVAILAQANALPQNALALLQ
ncbi:MAG: flagellin [Gammaproteobacteria bacterium]|nr:flagellin [Gammaproteobacteria bacterium]